MDLLYAEKMAEVIFTRCIMDRVLSRRHSLNAFFVANVDVYFAPNTAAMCIDFN